MARLWLYQGQPVTCSHLDGTCLERERDRDRAQKSKGEFQARERLLLAACLALLETG